MANVNHKEITPSEAHAFAITSATDPGAIGAGRGWIDTSGGGVGILKVRNSTNTGWDNMSGASETPTITSFVNAEHDHADAAGGGTLDGSVIASGLVTTKFGGTGADLSAVAGGIVTVPETGEPLAVKTGGANGQILVWDSSQADNHSYIDRDGAIQFIIDGGGSAITAGFQYYLEIPCDCVIESAAAAGASSGSIVVDVWYEADVVTNGLPDDADSITASAPITLSSAVFSIDTTLTGWTKALAKGGWIGIKVDSATTVKRVTISLKVKKTAVT